MFETVLLTPIRPDSIVRHAFSNIRTIFKTARKMKFIVEDPAEDLLMPDTRTVKKPRTQPELILKLIDAMPHPRDRALLAVGCFCGPRTSEDLGLTWKSYAFDHFIGMTPPTKENSTRAR